MHRPALILAAIAAVFPAIASAGDGGDPWILQFQLENDLFNDTDRDYTNGWMLSIITPDVDGPDAPDWLRSAGTVTRPLADALGCDAQRLGFGIGQLMFTPEDWRSYDLIEDDRPYAGWLFGEIAWHGIRKPADGVCARLDTLQLQVGVVGPSALAQEAQDFIHDLRNFDRFNGWDNQLEDEPGINLAWTRRWRHTLAGNHDDGLCLDLMPSITASVGNVETSASVGGEMRAGWNVADDFGSDSLRPGSARTVRAAPSPGNAFGAYVFAGVRGRAIARDIFLDGNTFADSHSVDKEALVGDFSYGLRICISDTVNLGYTQVVRTREFDGQSAHSFGSVDVSIQF